MCSVPARSGASRLFGADMFGSGIAVEENQSVSVRPGRKAQQIVVCRTCFCTPTQEKPDPRADKSVSQEAGLEEAPGNAPAGGQGEGNTGRA